MKLRGWYVTVPIPAASRPGRLDGDGGFDWDPVLVDVPKDKILRRCFTRRSAERICKRWHLFGHTQVRVIAAAIYHS